MQTPINSYIRSLALLWIVENEAKHQSKYDAMMAAYMEGFNKATAIHENAVKKILNSKHE